MNKKRNKRKHVRFNVKMYLTILGISLAVILSTFFVAMGCGIFTGNIGKTDDAEEMVVPVDKATGKVNALVMGVDADGLRTDTIMVASYDLDNGKINILSIPRDTRMYIGTKYQKINAAHAVSVKGAKKGPEGTIEAVTRLTGIPINYYVEFSFETFRDTIDALGGVYFDVPRDMKYDDPVQNLHINLKQGYQFLDGDKAEQLVRFRRYPEGDIARVAMQQNFLKAVFEQKLNAGIITKLPDLYKQLSKNITTNVKLSDVVKYVPNISDLAMENIAMYQLPGGFNDKDYGASYWVCNMEETKTLIENTFGYDASNITIHSADGTSAKKDKATSTQTPKKDSSATAKPKATAKPTSKPTATATVKPTAKATTKPSATKKPTETAKAEKTAKATVKPKATAKPTHTPAPAE